MQARAGSVAVRARNIALLFKAMSRANAAAYPALSIDAAVALCNSVQADATDDRCGGPRARRGVAAAKRTLFALLCHSVGRSAVRERARAAVLTVSRRAVPLSVSRAQP